MHMYVCKLGGKKYCFYRKFVCILNESSFIQFVNGSLSQHRMCKYLVFFSILSFGKSTKFKGGRIHANKIVRQKNFYVLKVLHAFSVPINCFVNKKDFFIVISCFSKLMKQSFYTIFYHTFVSKFFKFISKIQLKHTFSGPTICIQWSCLFVNVFLYSVQYFKVAICF